MPPQCGRRRKVFAIENLRHKSLAGLTVRSYQKCDAALVVLFPDHRRCIVSRARIKAIAAKRFLGRRKTGNLWSPLEYSRKSKLYFGRGRGIVTRQHRNRRSHREKREIMKYIKMTDRAFSLVASTFLSRRHIINKIRAGSRDLDELPPPSLEKYASETNPEENGWNSGVFAIPSRHPGCSYVTRDHYVIHLASRAISILYRVLLYIFLARDTHERGASTSGHVYVNGGLPRAIYCATPRKHSGARHSLDARVSARQAELYESPVKIFLLVRKDSLYISRRCNPTEHECNSFPQGGRHVHRLPETKREK